MKRSIFHHFSHFYPTPLTKAYITHTLYMAEDYCGGPNWWDSSSRNRFDTGGGGGGGSSSTCSTTMATGGYGWLTEASTAELDINSVRSSLETVPGPTQGDPKMESGSSLLVGLGLSSQALDWNQQPILRNPEKTDNSFRSMLQEGMGLNPNFHQDLGSQVQWRDKLFSSNEDSPEFKQIGSRGFSLEQPPHFSPSCSSMESTVTCQGLATPTTFHLDSSSSSSLYGSPSGILQGLIGPPDQQNQQQPTQINYQQQNYFDQQQLSPSWAKVPQFLRGSPPKHQQQQQQQQSEYHQLHFTNNAPYWNASSPVNNQPNFFSSLQTQIPTPAFEEKPKNTLEVKGTSTTAKKGTGAEMNNKRGRNEAASSTLPPFKVKKEKMGDRITALQQLVSPFGKTDTASVLSEAIEYIKFLHEQVLSTPYLKSGAPYQQQQQNNEKAKMDPDAPKQDLRSRGLCLVPVPSTFPVTHETAVDFWAPAFGGSFR